MNLDILYKTDEDSLGLREREREILVYKIIYSTLKKIVKTNLLKPSLKKKLLFLMTTVSQEDLAKLENEGGYKIHVLGLTPQMTSQLNEINFTLKELKFIQDIFYEELPKIIQELSESVVEFDSGIKSELDSGLLSYSLAQNLQKLVVDNNQEIQNNIQLQNKLIKLIYKDIPEKELKKIENYERDLKDTLKEASDIQKKTLNAIYPAKEYYDKMKIAVSGFEEELSLINKELEELRHLKESYQAFDQKEFLNITSQFKELKTSRYMYDMTLREIKLFGYDNTSFLNSSIDNL